MFLSGTKPQMVCQYFNLIKPFGKDQSKDVWIVIQMTGVQLMMLGFLFRTCINSKKNEKLHSHIEKKNVTKYTNSKKYKV